MSNETAARDTNETKAARIPNRRRRKFVRKDLQLKIIFGTLFVALIVLVINFQLPIMGMWIMRATSSIWLDTHYDLMIKLLVTSFVTSFLLTIPLALWMGIVFSFQFCGPIYKIKKFFVELNAGRWDTVCHLRKRDDLKDVRDVINQFVGQARDRLRSQHEALAKVRAFLETCDGNEAVDPLVKLIDEEAAEYGRRLGPVGATEDATAVASPGEGSSATPQGAEPESSEATDAEVTRGQGAAQTETGGSDSPADAATRQEEVEEDARAAEADDTDADTEKATDSTPAPVR